MNFQFFFFNDFRNFGLTMVSLTFILSFISSLVLFDVVHCDIFCSERYSCANSSQLIDPDGEIACGGYKSCYGIDLIEAGSRIFCGAAWSCADVSQVMTTSVVDISCGGMNSCENSSIGISNVTTISNNWVDCYGANSCAETRIYGANHAWCSGESSCSYSTIDNTPQITFKGSHSGVGTRINSINIPERTTLIVNFNGYYSGYNSTVYCWNDQTCNINCKGNGCLGVILLYDVNADYTVDCNESIGIWCPIVINYNYTNGTVDYNYNSNYNYNYHVTNGTGLGLQFMFPNGYSSMEHANVFEDICETNGTVAGTDANDLLLSTRCLDSFQCDNLATIDLISDGIFDSICCAGEWSCENNNILTVNPNYDIIAIGYQSVWKYLNPNATLRGRTINNRYKKNNSTFYCDGHFACSGVKLYNSDLAHCAGGFSCSDTQFYDINTIICSSEESCKNSYIYNAKSIYVTSIGALEGSYINTKELASNDDCQTKSVVNIWLLSDNFDNDDYNTINITCEVGNICNIFCGTNDACLNVEVNCYGRCNISCEAYGNYAHCPQVFEFQDNNRSSSCLPTFNPTTVPTANPTVNPSTIPSSMPSKPTENPTYLPSSVPSQPTETPTYLPTAVPTSTTDVPSQFATDLPTGSPSRFPTPITTTPITERGGYGAANISRISSIYNLILVIFIPFVICLLLLGVIDGKLLRKNSQFKSSGILFFGMYSLDFISGMFHL